MSRSRSSAARTMPRPSEGRRRFSLAGDAGQAADGVASSARCSPSSSPGRSGRSIRIATKVRATAQGYHADQMWLSGSARGPCRARGRLPGLPRHAVRRGARPELQACHTDIHDHADLRRLAAGAAPTSAASGGCSRLSAPSSARIRAAASIAIPSMRGRSEMPPTPQRFCADCHTDLRGSLPDTRLGRRRRFRRRASRVPARGSGRLDRRATAYAAGGAERPRRVERSNLKFPHALHLAPRGGVAQMGRRLASRYGFGDSLQCRDCHVPDDRRRALPAASTWRAIAACATASRSTRSAARSRTLRHGAPRR